MEHGDSYYISGTVAAIPDGTVVTITIQNSWFNPVTMTSGSYSITTPATVSGGAFVTSSSYPFNGGGGYTVNAVCSYNGSTFNDSEQGGVNAPMP